MSRAPLADHSAAADRGSSGTAASRWLTSDASTMTSHPEKSSPPPSLASAAGAGSAVWAMEGMSKATLVPASWWTSVSPLAASGSATTAGLGSIWTTTCSAASAAAAAVSATTATTGSPTNRTVSRAKIGRAILWLTTGIVGRSGKSRSAAANTPSTPGQARAPAVSTLVRRPRAKAERTKQAWALLSNLRSAT